MLLYVFAKLVRSIVVFRIGGCLHWLSSALRSRCMADHHGPSRHWRWWLWRFTIFSV